AAAEGGWALGAPVAVPLGPAARRDLGPTWGPRAPAARSGLPPALGRARGGAAGRAPPIGCPARRPAEPTGQRAAARAAPRVGAHLDEVGLSSDARDLRQLGSKGERRLAVLSLLLAEAELLPEPPLLLLDDVLSELDLGRRRTLVERVSQMGQSVITSTHVG